MEYGREEVSRRLATVGEIVRDHVLQELRRQSSESLSTIAFETAADKIYVIDRSVETVLLPALVEHLQPAGSFALICEGVNDEQPLALPEGTPVDECRARLIVDPIDGTRPIMYNKRSAWWLAGLAPNRSDEASLQDIDVAVQVEIPTTRAALADTLWAIRGRGVSGVTTNLINGERTSFQPQPSRAATINDGFASIFHPFPGGKEVFATIEEELAREIIGGLGAGKKGMFDDPYPSPVGQAHELRNGR